MYLQWEGGHQTVSILQVHVVSCCFALLWFSVVDNWIMHSVNAFHPCCRYTHIGGLTPMLLVA